MGCGQSFDAYNVVADYPISPRQPPQVPICPELVVPPYQQQWGFILKPAMFSATGNDFTVMNQLGQPIAIVRGKFFSLHDKQQILSPTGVPLLQMEKKLFGLHHTYYLTDPRTNMIVGTIRKRITLFTPVYELYRGEQYDDPNNLIWRMQGDFFSMRYSILDLNGPIAKAQANPFSQFTNFGMNGLNFNETYFVEVASGVESILALAMCLVADEVRAEQIREQQNEEENTMMYGAGAGMAYGAYNANPNVGFMQQQQGMYVNVGF